jgi:hypothetical protein
VNRSNTLAATLTLTLLSIATAARAADPAPQPAERAELERKFAELLTGAEMVGSYTASDDPNPGKEDRYSVIRAVKGEGDEWAITFNMGYKALPLPLTITVPVKWAGDTPVIVLTNKKIPGVGTFNARVLFHENAYAGTWSSAKHGGTMWGRIERAKPNDAKTKPAAAAPAPKAEK